MTADRPSLGALRRLLVERFPLCFVPRGKTKRPLKVGIRKDIAEALPDVPIETIGAFLHDYTGGARYQRGIALAPHRVDLNGAPAGAIPEQFRRKAERNLAAANAERAAVGKEAI